MRHNEAHLPMWTYRYRYPLPRSAASVLTFAVHSSGLYTHRKRPLCNFLTSLTILGPAGNLSHMADPLTVIGIVTNIVQLVDFSTKVFERINDFQSKHGENKKAFQHVKAQLPLLQEILRQTKEKIDNGTIEESTKAALLPAVEGCKNQVEALDDLVAKTLPAVGDSSLKSTAKAIRSIGRDGKIESITKILRGYIATLTFYHAAASSTLQPLTGGYTWYKHSLRANR